MSPDPSDRIVTLDVVRGVAVLGILLMNAVSFGLFDPAYFNITAGGGDDVVNRAIAVVGEVFIDQKFMGVFSALFGAGIVLFVDRIGARRRHPVLLGLWRNALLVVIGVVHATFWDGDVLIVYGLCAPVLFAVRRLPVRAAFIAGGVLMALAAASGPITQSIVNASGGAGQLGWFWFDQDLEVSDAVALFVIGDGFARALGMMLIGVGLHRTGVLTGARTDAWYRRAALIGFGVGAPLTAIGVVWLAAVDHSWRDALAATAPNTVATAPMTIGIIAVIILASRRWRRFADAMVPVGRMALTNYLTQTALGLVVLREVFTRGEHTRLGLLVFAVAVWALQITWSRLWFRRFSQGPIEWLWRTATYLRPSPISADRTVRSSA